VGALSAVTALVRVAALTPFHASVASAMPATPAAA